MTPGIGCPAPGADPEEYARYLGEEKGRQRAVNALLRMGYKYGEIRPALAEVLEELGVEEELDPED